MLSQLPIGSASFNDLLNIIIPRESPMNPPNSHRRSLSCCTVQKEMSRNCSPLRESFVPFCHERDLGRLIPRRASILSLSNPTHRPPSRLNFGHFKQLYRRVAKDEQLKYSLQTRASSQPNLVKEGLWRKQSLAKLTPCFQKSRRKEVREEVKEGKALFQKSNYQLYKKLKAVVEPKWDGELMEMYGNYIKICELNENIRREEIVRGY